MSCHQRQCQRCKCGAVDDAHHMVFRCTALAAQRVRPPRLYLTDSGDLRKLLDQSPTSMAAFIYGCYSVCCSL